MCMGIRVHVYLCTTCVQCPHYPEVSDVLRLELQTVVDCYGRGASAFNHQAISLAPTIFLKGQLLKKEKEHELLLQKTCQSHGDS